ncbi:MAG TPA: GNAT family N-acetyltransferase [Bacteroidetes bacterium]|nr:GNAT family N-acetyltransferase [Bacteroidota bacterium]
MKPSAPLHIRHARPEDAELIAQLIKELAVYEKLENEAVAAPEILKKNLFGERPAAEVLLAEWESETAGFALFFHNFSTFVGKPGLYLEDIFVRERFRGQGIGKALMMELVQIARQRGCGRMEWAVLHWNPARKFYEKLGAVPMSDWVVYRLTEDKMQRLQ